MSTTNKGQKRGALGKGINSLLGDVDAQEYSSGRLKGATAGKPQDYEVVLKVSPEQVDPNPQQPRRFFHDDKLKELAASIETDGVLQPIVVSKGEKPGRYTLIAGERRWRASKMCGKKSIPVIVKEGVADDLLRLALIENIQRSDLNVIEEAQAYKSLIDDHGLTQERCAQKLGKERSTVANVLRILTLPKEVQDDLIAGRLATGHGRALLTLEDKKLILRARDMIIKKSLSVRKAEELCKSLKKTGGEPSLSPSGSQPDLNYIADKLRSTLRTKVKVSGSGSRGKIEISYFSPSELDRLVLLINTAEE